MYHYVRPTIDEYPYLRALHLDDFRSQLDELGDSVGFADQTEFLAAMEGETPLPSGCVLTFDDGLADHVDFVLPELVDRGLWGMFYVPVGPHLEGRMLVVHRVHALLARLPAATVLEALLVTLATDDVDQELAEVVQGKIYRGRDDAEAAIAVRSLLNYYVRPERRASLLDEMEAATGCATEPKDWYADAEGLVQLAQSGMLVGSHSVSHVPMAQLSVPEQEREIVDSFGWIESVLGAHRPPRTFCYPYGGFHTFTPDTERLLSEHCVGWSFNVEAREVTDDDVATRPQALPRVDCCELPHGRSRVVQPHVVHPG
jgi:peptidoglycan/xylan/chitin deacetylase (PgdA/CDA1 family)